MLLSFMFTALSYEPFACCYRGFRQKVVKLEGQGKAIRKKQNFFKKING